MVLELQSRVFLRKSIKLTIYFRYFMIYENQPFWRGINYLFKTMPALLPGRGVF
jgi:hypothetical protein